MHGWLVIWKSEQLHPLFVPGNIKALIFCNLCENIIRLMPQYTPPEQSEAEGRKANGLLNHRQHRLVYWAGQ